jgi:hypothetical protein
MRVKYILDYLIIYFIKREKAKYKEKKEAKKLRKNI